MLSWVWHLNFITSTWTRPIHWYYITQKLWTDKLKLVPEHVGYPWIKINAAKMQYSVTMLISTVGFIQIRRTYLDWRNTNKLLTILVYRNHHFTRYIYINTLIHTLAIKFYGTNFVTTRHCVPYACLRLTDSVHCIHYNSISSSTHNVSSYSK